jgi:hypothetical protein
LHPCAPDVFVVEAWTWRRCEALAHRPDVGFLLLSPPSLEPRFTDACPAQLKLSTLQGG